MSDITPGIYTDMSNEAYQAVPALSKSGVGALVDECPAAYWFTSPHNPARESENRTAFDLGTAAHLIFLEPHLLDRRIVVINADSYRTKDAQEKRDAAYAAGLTPLLPQNLAAIMGMREALMAHPIAKGAFAKPGHAERSHFWRDKKSGVLLKARPDFEAEDGSYVVDYKTTASANPRDFQKRVFEHYYFVQQPWYLDGIEATTGKRPDNFFFVAQETKPPYLVSVFELDDQTVEWGKRYAAKAIEIYANCLKSGDWPGYRDPQHPDKDRLITIGLPGYASYQLADRDEAGEFSTGILKRRGHSRFHMAQVPQEIVDA